MILKHVHLFGILLLSLLLASFLGHFLDINNNNNKEGLDNDDDAAEPRNRHTGGPLSSTSVQPQLEVAVGPDASDDPDASDASKSIFGGAFDTVLPSERYGNSIEPFIAPFREGLANDTGSGSMGIPADKIPPGQDHLYVLKSQMVPPTTCPVCPIAATGNSGSGNKSESVGDSSGLSNGLGSAFGGGGATSNSNGSTCPPCPACARCPEPSFDCKKVPNYSIGQNGSMSVPRPVLADFSQFGM